jgi:hypothetical protein
MNQSQPINIDAYQLLSEFDPIWIDHYLSSIDQAGLVSAEKNKGKQQRCARVMIKHLVLVIIFATQQCAQTPSLTLQQALKQLLPLYPLTFYHQLPIQIIDLIPLISIQKDPLGAPLLLFQGKKAEALQLSMSHDENMVYVSLAFDSMAIQQYFLNIQ